MAKEAGAGAVKTKQAARKTMRKLEKVQSAFRKSERRVGKLRVQLERAEAKLAARVQKLSELESRLQSPGEEGQDDPNHGAAGGQISAPEDGRGDPVVAYTPLAGVNGAAAHPAPRGKKGARGKR